MSLQIFHLDLRTIVFSTILANTMIALGMCEVARIYPDIRGSRRWAAGCALQTAGWFSFCLRGHSPEFVTVFLGSLLPVVSVAFFYATFAEFSGQRPNMKRVAAMLAPTAAGLFLFWYAQPNLMARMACISFGAAGMVLMCVQALLGPTHRRHSFSQRITAVVLVAASAALLIRAALAVFGAGVMADSTERGQFNLFLYASVNATTLVVTFGYLSMCHERFRAEALQLATIDPLTGTLNRRAMEEVLREQTRSGLDRDRSLSVLLLDMDHFKEINDTFGHAVGDLVLKSAVDAIRRRLRARDHIARWGGEEFLIALPGTPARDAEAIAESLRVEIRRLCVVAGLEGEERVRTSVSIGVASHSATDNDFDALVRRADDALYESKNAGRNRVTGSACHIARDAVPA